MTVLNSNNKKRVLVTGGTGFIGSALVKRLVKEGYQVFVFDNNFRGASSKIKDVMDKITFIEGDIRDAKQVEDACKGMDVVHHLAYINGTEHFYNIPEKVLEVAGKGMINIIDGCIKHGVKEFYLASSSEAYQTPPEVPTKEDVRLIVPDPLNARYSYGGGKIFCELMAINYGRKYFNKMAIYRPHNVYGPDMGYEHVLPQFTMRMHKLLEKESHHDGQIKFQIQGNGTETRSFIFIDDFIDGIMLIMDKGEHLNIYHLGTMEELSVLDTAKLVGKSFNKEIEIVPGELQHGGTPRRCPDIGKMMKLGFHPKVKLEKGLPILVDWYVKNINQWPNKN